MKKFLSLILVTALIIAVSKCVTGMYDYVQGQKIIRSLEGSLYYLIRNEDLSVDLLKTTANLTDSNIVARSFEPSNRCIASYQVYNDSTLRYMAMSNGESAEFSINLNSKDTTPVLQRFVSLDSDFFEPVIRDENSQGRLYSDKGNIVLVNPSGQKQELLHFYGRYDSKFALGFHLPQWSPDGNYIIFYYSGNRTAFAGIAESLIETIFEIDNFNPQTYVMKFGEKKYYPYIKGLKLTWEY